MALDPNGFRHLTFRLSDPAEFGLAMSGATLAADFLAPQCAPALIEQFQSPRWALDFHEVQVKARICGPLATGWASLGLMRGQAESSFHNFATGPGVLICNPPGEGIDGRVTPGFACSVVNVPHTLWEKGRLLSGVERTHFGSVMARQLPADLFARIECRLHTVRERLRTARTPEAMRQASYEAEEAAVHLATLSWRLSAATDTPVRDALRNRARLARRAEDWMREHLAESLPISAACLALRVSRRELEYAFRWSFDTSPRDFLYALRLNAVRRALQSHADRHLSVSRLALDHGITHFGRFSAHYRDFFGEKPSETRPRIQVSRVKKSASPPSKARRDH